MIDLYNVTDSHSFVSSHPPPSLTTVATQAAVTHEVIPSAGPVQSSAHSILGFASVDSPLIGSERFFPDRYLIHLLVLVWVLSCTIAPMVELSLSLNASIGKSRDK